ncbi:MULTISPECIES: hypothetical protein [Haloferacaceae]|uniref:Uncharacterized protein n=2 Tax=Haloferacaceae TaxID=1644056 RepID=A0ABD6DEL2_9EURY|nr:MULTISPECIES: hypothetical protein [Halorubraceae]
MSQYPLSKTDARAVRSVSLTESHHGRRPAREAPLAAAHTDNGTLALHVGAAPGETPPLADVDLETVFNIQLVDTDGEPLTNPEYLLGVDPVSEGHLHLFTDSTL